jgi:hypothetical protein
MKDREKVAQGIKLIATVNGIAAILHIAFWTFVFLHLPRPWTISASAQQIDLIVTYGLGVADLLWSVPFLIAGSIWLSKRWLVGWLAAQMSNALWWYSFTFILIRELSMHNIRPGTILFLPFALFSLWSAWYLWKVKSFFWQTNEKVA